MSSLSPSVTRIETTSTLAMLAHHGDAVRAVAQRAEPGDVVGMQVRVDRLDQLEIELVHELQVAVDLLQHRIDDQRLAAAPAGEQIAVGAGDAVEQLAEDHAALRVLLASAYCRPSTVLHDGERRRETGSEAVSGQVRA